MERLSRLWRIVRVGLVYVAWAVAVLVTTLAVVPLLRLAGRGADGQDLLTQRCLQHAARFVIRFAVALGVIELALSGVERLGRPGALLLVANHPTMLDATLVVALLPQLDTVVEMSWAETPIVAGAVARAGYLCNDSARKVVEEGAARLRAGRRLLIFPEGSRSPAGSLHPFRRGAARIALASGCEPVPVVIRCDPPIGLKGKAWYDIPKDTPRMSISVGEAMAVGDLVDQGDSRGVAARKVNDALRDYFLRELNYADVRHD